LVFRNNAMTVYFKPNEPGTQPSGSEIAADAKIGELAELSKLAYQKRRKEEAKTLGIPVGTLDKLVSDRRATVADEGSMLPHWRVEPWNGEVSGADLLDELSAVFHKYIVLPRGAGEALALLTLHSWTMNAGDVSPFLVLVSPTKRCGKTSVLILLFHLTPRSVLASNISPSALFRYIEHVRPTLLIDEADSFVADNEEMRGILNSGHTKAAAFVIRNVEINGEHKPRRFSTWAPKAIATIRKLADTLEDRAIVVRLQRKPKTADVARLRTRDCDEFAILRRKAACWAANNFELLADDPNPAIPPELNDRAADNWRPLFAIADLVGGGWSQRARNSACILSGEGHESTSVNVELLADIRLAFGDDEAMRTVDLVDALTANPERPWSEWRRSKPLTPKQLGGLLAPFGIQSETVSIRELKDAKGYKRERFREAWAAYLPAQSVCQNSFSPTSCLVETSKRRTADGIGVSRDFLSVAERSSDVSKNSDKLNSHAGFDVSTFRQPKNWKESESDHEAFARPLDGAGGDIAARVSDLWET
jgi:putative DNA primase/helicase